MADKPRRPSQPDHKNSAGKLIENLTFLSNVDTMLLEGVAATDVALYIQQEMGQLVDLDPKSLANALRARKKQKEEVARAFSGRMADEVDGAAGVDPPVEVVETKVVRPTLLAKKLYARTRGGIRDLIELEAMYLTQRDRVDRMVQAEGEQGIFTKDVGAEIIYAGQLIMMRVKTKHDLGIDDTGDTPELDMRKYSEKTIGVLSNAKSRHKIMSLLNRLARAADLSVDPEEQIALPPPASTPEK